MSIRTKSGDLWNRYGDAVILTLGLVSTIAGAYFAAWAVPRANKAVGQAENARWDDYISKNGPNSEVAYVPLNKWEMFKIQAVYYLPSALCVLISLGSSIYTFKVGNERLKDANATIMQLMANTDTIMRVVGTNVSAEKMAKIKKDLAAEDVKSRHINVPKFNSDDGKYTFIEPISGQVFRSDADSIRRAIEIDANERMMNSDRLTLNDVIECLINRGATNLVMSEVGDAVYWEPNNSADYLKVPDFSEGKDDNGNPYSYINYNRPPKTFSYRR